MASPAFRQISSMSGATRNGTVTIDKPTGTVDDDIMLCFFYVETDNTVSTPAGWSTAIETVDNNGTSFPHRLYVYWKRASSEGANYTFTWTGNVWQEVAILSYSGCITSESPIDISTSGKVESDTGNQPGNDPDIFPTLSFTTTVADTKLVYFCICSYFLGATTPPTNFAERGEVSEYEVADKDQASIGGSGNVVSTQTTNNMGSTSAIMVALKPPSTAATLSGNNSSHTHSAVVDTFSQNHIYQTVNSSHSQSSTVDSFTQIHIYSIVNSSHLLSSLDGTFTQNHIYITENCLHAATSDVLTFLQNHLLEISGAVSDHSALLVTFTQEHIVVIAGALHSHVAGQVTFASQFLNQEGFRFRYDDGDEASATWIVAQDQIINVPMNQTIRLRLLLNSVGDIPEGQFQLEYRKVGEQDWAAVSN